MSTEELKKALKICITGCDYCYKCPYRQTIGDTFLDENDMSCSDKLYEDIVQLIEQK